LKDVNRAALLPRLYNHLRAASKPNRSHRTSPSRLRESRDSPENDSAASLAAVGVAYLIFEASMWRATYLSMAPDWVCEVVSPSTERVDRARF
jgi:hypothetical protein